jgi:hypothetical protein
MEVALVVQYDGVVPGREMQALDLGTRIIEFWRQASQAGGFAPPESLLLSSGRAIWFVWGDEDAIRRTMESEQGELLAGECQIVFDGFRSDFAVTSASGDGYQPRHARARMAPATPEPAEPLGAGERNAGSD